MTQDEKPDAPPEPITTLIHSMGKDDTITIDGKIEISLQRTRIDKATLRIRAPKSIRIKRSNQLPPNEDGREK